MVELYNTIISFIVGGLTVWVVIHFQNKRWTFSHALEARTKHILDTYDDFLNAFFKINKAANIGSDKTTFDEDISKPLDKYLIAINKMDLWIKEESSNELRGILGIFRIFANDIASKSVGGDRYLKSKDWETFIDSLPKMKAIVKEELNTEALRKFIIPQQTDNGSKNQTHPPKIKK